MTSYCKELKVIIFSFTSVIVTVTSLVEKLFATSVAFTVKE